jgi:hypothetical protein
MPLSLSSEKCKKTAAQDKRADFPEFPRPAWRDPNKTSGYDEMSFRGPPVVGTLLFAKDEVVVMGLSIDLTLAKEE